VRMVVGNSVTQKIHEVKTVGGQVLECYISADKQDRAVQISQKPSGKLPLSAVRVRSFNLDSAEKPPRKNSKLDARMSSLAPADRVVICPVVRGEIRYGIEQLPQSKRRQDLETQAGPEPQDERRSS